ncbi:MAG: hypothetical protein ABJG78_02090 [Cyclobacteriaceae bacterium]
MLDTITSLHTETIVLLVALILALINALVAALRAESWMKLGRSSMVSKNYSAAIHYFTNEINDDPKNAAAYLERAEAYQLSGDETKALEDKLTASELNAKSATRISKKKVDRIVTPRSGSRTMRMHASPS